MATLLYRLGRFSFRRRLIVLLGWVVVLALFGVGAATLSGPTNDAFNIPGTESFKALAVLKAKMGVGADNADATVVFHSPSAALTATTQKAAVEAAIVKIKAASQVAAVADPYTSQTISQDGKTAYATVSYSVGEADVTDAAKSELIAAGRTATSAGIEVNFEGTATQAQTDAGGATEGIGIVVAAIVLVVTFGALIAAGMPLVSAIVGVVSGMLGIQIATGFFDLSSSTNALSSMLGLAVGIDYALFIVSRFRHELQEGRDGDEAAGRAAGTAGSAVVFAGLTVIIALSALSVTGIPFLTAMGLAAAGTVLMAVLITLTLIPALLGFAGRRVLSKRDRMAHAAPPRTLVPFGERYARGVVRHRVYALIGPLVLIALVSIPALHLRLALPDDSTAAPSSTQRKAYDQLAAAFGAGFNGPLIIVVEGTSGTASAAATAARTKIVALSDVVVATAPAVNTAGDTAMLTVIAGSGTTTDATKALVTAIRGLGVIDGATLSVTGTTAINIDITAKITSALVPYLIIVVGLAFVLLMLVFRSVLVPLKAAIGFLLSVAATFGAVVAVFQWGWLAGLIGLDTTGPIMSLMPIFLIGILFGLAMDYEVFLVTRTREEFVHGAGPDEAVVTGMRHGARVVTAAALIMMSVFAGFVLSSDSIIKTLGFALAFGVAVDAFLVRMTIVPAVLSLLGRSAWWLPSWLDRVLPDVDVEGANLAKHLAGASEEGPAVDPDHLAHAA